MSPRGIQRTVALLLLLSPWIFTPELYKEVIFFIMGLLLFISTLDLRKKVVHSDHHEETESNPHTPPMNT